MATTRRQTRKRSDLRKALPPSTPLQRARKGQGAPLMLMVPAETLRALRTRAAENTTTVRALVLKALRAADYFVPEDEIIDRRRPRLIE